MIILYYCSWLFEIDNWCVIACGETINDEILIIDFHSFYWNYMPLHFTMCSTCIEATVPSMILTTKNCVDFLVNYATKNVLCSYRL